MNPCSRSSSTAVVLSAFFNRPSPADLLPSSSRSGGFSPGALRTHSAVLPSVSTRRAVRGAATEAGEEGEEPRAGDGHPAHRAQSSGRAPTGRSRARRRRRPSRRRRPPRMPSRTHQSPARTPPWHASPRASSHKDHAARRDTTIAGRLPSRRRLWCVATEDGPRVHRRGNRSSRRRGSRQPIRRRASTRRPPNHEVFRTTTSLGCGACAPPSPKARGSHAPAARARMRWATTVPRHEDGSPLATYRR